MHRDGAAKCDVATAVLSVCPSLCPSHCTISKQLDKYLFSLHPTPSTILIFLRKVTPIGIYPLLICGSWYDANLHFVDSEPADLVGDELNLSENTMLHVRL